MNINKEWFDSTSREEEGQILNKYITKIEQANFEFIDISSVSIITNLLDSNMNNTNNLIVDKDAMIENLYTDYKLKTNNLIVTDIYGNDTSLNNLDIRDICGNDASFNKINVKDLIVDGSLNVNNYIYNNIEVQNKTIFSTSIDISNTGTGPALKVTQYGNGYSVALFNAGSEGDSMEIDYKGDINMYKNVDIYGDISANDASFNNVEIKDICGNDASFNNIDIRDICGNDASFNNIDIRDICGNDASFNNIDLNNLSITGVISAPNLTTLTIGQMKMGTNTYHTNMASFGNTIFENGQTNYAFGQATDGHTFMNATNNMYFKKNNTDRMILRDDGDYNTLELNSPNSIGTCKLRMKHGNGSYWDIEAPTSECRWKYNGNGKMHISVAGDLKVYRDILALGNISANDASFNNIDIRDVCGNDASFNNVEIRGDICGNDASFNNVWIRGDICGNDASFNNINIRDICANDVSINNVVIRGDICGNDASFNNIDIRDICGNDASFNNVMIRGDICGNDASFNNIDIRDICGNDASFNNSYVNNLSVTGVFSTPNINIVNLNTLVIGNALMGNSAHENHAVFCHKDLNTERDYALLQASWGNKTYLNCRNGGQILFRQHNYDRMKIRDDGNYNTLELLPPQNGGQCRLRMKHDNGSYWDCEAPTSNIRWKYNGGLKFYINTNGDTVANGNIYSNDTATGYNTHYTNTYGMWSHRIWNNDPERYMALQEQGGDSFLNGYNYLNLCIKNVVRLYIDILGAYLPGPHGISSDDRLKFEEQDISGLSIIRQLNPKKYIKIDLPYVKKRRRYYDENEITIIDNYIYDICQNEIDKINKERQDISLNDLSSNDYYKDEDYIHKDIITEEDVNAFVTQEDISNGQIECGLIAQEVLETDISWVVHQQKIPEDIQKPLFQPLSVRYDDIYPYTIQAIKELDVIVQGIRDKLNLQEDKINNLEAENDIIEARVHDLEKM